MVKKWLAICLLLALHYTNAAEENDSIKFSSPTKPDLQELFQIPEVTPDARYDQKFSELVAASVMDFAHDLGEALDQGDFPNTQIFSPLSVMSALSLLQMGANTNSYTQLNRLFKFMPKSADSAKVHEEFGWMLEDILSNRRNLQRPRNENGEWRNTPANQFSFGKGGKNTPNDHIIRIANGIFVQDGFKLRDDYKYAAQHVYKSEMQSLDFRYKQEAAKHYINSWVNQNTLGKIPAIIADEVNRDTNMVIASALYFKGFWEQPFLGSGTTESNFYPDGPNGAAVKVMMMGTGGVYPYYDSKEYNCQIIGLPYKGNQTTMYIIQPRDSTRLKLQALQRALTGDKINEMISKMEYKTAVMAFPKFHVTSTLQLKKSLMRMGIEDVFFNGRSDLSLIADAGQLLGSEPALAPALAAAQAPAMAPALQLPSYSQAQQEVFSPVPQESVASLQSTSDFANRNNKLVPTGIYDRYNTTPLIFARFGDESLNPPTARSAQRVPIIWRREGNLTVGTPQYRFKRTVTYKVESEFMRNNAPLRLKDLILSKRITKANPGKKLVRNRRQAGAIPLSAQSLQNLDRIRFTPGLQRPPLYVDDVLHKVDFEVNEQGTEAAAATLTYLRRSGTDVAFRCEAPFLLLIRHDPTKLPLFYGKVNIPMA